MEAQKAQWVSIQQMVQIGLSLIVAHLKEYRFQWEPRKLNLLRKKLHQQRKEEGRWNLTKSTKRKQPSKRYKDLRVLAKVC